MRDAFKRQPKIYPLDRINASVTGFEHAVLARAAAAQFDVRMVRLVTGDYLIAIVAPADP
jgi:hypothetical protein